MFVSLLKVFSPCKRRGVSQATRWAILVVIAILGLVQADDVSAQKRWGHQLIGPNDPPGAIGRKQLLGNKHRRGYIQPVRLDVPKSNWIATSHAGEFADESIGHLQVGLQIGEVYRFKVTSATGDYIVYPTVELIDRLYPPQGSEQKFPVPVELTESELRLAAAGNFVTRVIYLEDPGNALPYRQDAAGEQDFFEVFPDQDPVEAAFGMGRPVAILRMGSKAPMREEDGTEFSFGNPNVEVFPNAPVPMTRSTSVAPASYGSRHTEPRRLRLPSSMTPLGK